MLFSSNIFIFIFLPLTLLGYLATARLSRRAGFGWLVVASLIFYGWWDARFVPLLVMSIAVNFLCGEVIHRPRDRPRAATFALVTAIVLDLGALFRRFGHAPEHRGYRGRRRDP